MNEKFVTGQKTILSAGLSTHQLRATVRTLQAMIEAAPVKGEKGKKAYSIGELPDGV